MSVQQFKPGDKVYSKPLGRVGEFNGIIVTARGNGFQVLNPKTGKAYQRDRWDLIPLTAASEAKEREMV